MEQVLYKEGEDLKHCTQQDLLDALNKLSNKSNLVLISNGEDFFTIKEIVVDKEGEVIIRASKEPY